MQLTASERKRLELLHRSRERPPTWGKLLPRAVVLVLIWFALAIALGIFVGGLHSPVFYFCLGLFTFFPLLAINLVARSVGRWRLTDAITDWSRVEELRSAANRQGV